VSLASWKAEFYPKPADETTPEEAVAHSLQKWRGMRAEALARHGLVRREMTIYEEGNFLNSLNFDAYTCALCANQEGRGCEGCPLFESRGEVGCDEPMDEEERSPYSASGPEPMIAALEKAAEYEKAKC
jgi:hypothetical protein